MSNIFSPELSAFWERSQAAFDSALRTFLSSSISPYGESVDKLKNLDDAVAYALGIDSEAKPGKHIRPMLCLLCSHFLGNTSGDAMPFALAIEIMHNFTLVHDDIEDQDDWRRGRPSVWKKHGFDQGINIGDFMQNLVYRCLLQSQTTLSIAQTLRLCQLMTNTIEMTIRGQTLDMNARKQQIKMDEYMKIVTYKTGYCLAAPLVAGAIIAGADETTQATLTQIGLALGPLFQIRDDVIDLTANKGRAEIGSDIREGKRSVLVAIACDRAPQTQTQKLLQILDTPRMENTTDEILWCRDLFDQCGAFEQAKVMCDQLSTQMFENLDKLPRSLSAPLSEVIDYLRKRNA
ncbi:polyprenyl synthetase family protein [Candidatus Sumerlaeota bacterium]|nr:polyprenyl synthetase family protein [Candidatus Sumerlaeales bacterium]NLD61813.1 polyprenyl synthetase family protein [Candidatus Sumerlaeota bacterium]